MTPERRAELFVRVERALDVPMLILAEVFLCLGLAIPVFPLAPAATAVLEGILWLIWGVFAVELAVKTYLAPDRRRYLTTHWIDVLMVALPFLRPLRLLSILVVVSRSWEQAKRVLRRRTFSLIGVVSVITVLLTASMMYALERSAGGPIDTVADALWWSLSTITTVGYGDVYPVTNAGRGVAVFLMLTGISLFGLLTARVAAFLVEEDERDTQQPKLDDIVARLERIEQQMQENRGTRD
jgi:voltage-gated potassium channel